MDMSDVARLTWPRLLSIRYDGSNGAAVLAAAETTGGEVASWSMLSDDGVELRLRLTYLTPWGGHTDTLITAGQWVLIDGESGSITLLSDARFANQYVRSDDVMPEPVTIPEEG